jgi:hypothetical protein
MPVGQRQLFQAQEQRVAVHVTNNAAQSINNGAQVAINFQVESYDTHNMHDNVTNNTRLTCVIPGLYLVGATLSFGANAAGQRILDIIRFVSATTYVVSQTVPGSAGFNTLVSAAGIVRMVAGDYVEVQATQSSGGALNIAANAASNETSFWAVRLGS